MKKILIYIFTLLLTSCEGNNKEIKNTINQRINLPTNNNLGKESIKNMDTIYKQEHDDLTLVSTRTANNSTIEWKTILIDKDNDKLLLDSFLVDKAPESQKIEQDYGYTKLGHYTISTSYLDKNNLYIIYQNSGEIIVSKYTFDEKGSFKRNDKHIQDHFQTPHISENEVISTMDIFDDSMYINLLYKVSRLGKEQSLYKINLNLFAVKKIKFNEKHKTIKAYALTEFGKLDFSQNTRKIQEYNKMTNNQKKENKSSAPTEEEIDHVNNVKKYLDKPFYYEEMSLNLDDYNKEKMFFEKLGLKSYALFSSDSNQIEILPLDKSKTLNIKSFLKEVLTTYEKKEIRKYNYLGYIYQSQSHFTIFCFSKVGLDIEITRYDNYKNEWLIGGYKEVIIK